MGHRLLPQPGTQHSTRDIQQEHGQPGAGVLGAVLKPLQPLLSIESKEIKHVCKEHHLHSAMEVPGPSSPEASMEVGASQCWQLTVNGCLCLPAMGLHPPCSCLQPQNSLREQPGLVQHPLPSHPTRAWCCTEQPHFVRT